MTCRGPRPCNISTISHRWIGLRRRTDSVTTTACAVAYAEIARVDPSIGSSILVHSCLATLLIAQHGSEKQKQNYIPLLARLDMISTCKGAPGLRVAKIENKVALRIVQNGDVMFDNVFVPDEDKLPSLTSFQGFVEALSFARIMVAWVSIGVAMGVYDLCNRYVTERKQFGVPLAAFQLTQAKLVRMLGNIQAMFLTGWRLCKLHESGKMTTGHASMGKAWITLRARETVALGRELLGGNGILTDFLVAKAFCDMEPIYSYEGTYEINCLITGREITGIASFKPPTLKKRSFL
ncbi:hypothetical protein LUZ61_017284 [Rhynchospora tenuis]|uniref:Uncharacterized protein n=1 Tax=Rhynchospora tenuis TaxID=198213 RepID=A0AAD5Z755_9POAL|nr:hypothetical protein LUZ61_017284 [Rhynchospora tenuis]